MVSSQADLIWPDSNFKDYLMLDYFFRRNIQERAAAVLHSFHGRGQVGRAETL